MFRTNTSGTFRNGQMFFEVKVYLSQHGEPDKYIGSVEFDDSHVAGIFSGRLRGEA